MLFDPLDDNQGGGGGSGEQMTPAQRLYQTSEQRSTSGGEGGGGGGEEGGQGQGQQEGAGAREQQVNTGGSQQQRGPAEKAGTGEQPKPETVPVTDFAKIMAGALREAGVGQGQQRQAPEAKEMTDEEFRQATKYYSVKPEQVLALFGKPPVDSDDDAETQKAKALAWVSERQGILQQMIDGAATHATVLAGLQTTHLTGQLRQQVEPITRAQKEAAFDGFLGRLADAKPALKSMPAGQGKNVIKTAFESLRAKGFRPVGATEAERDASAEKAIYDEVVALAKPWNTNFSLDQAMQSAGGGTQRGGGRAAGMGSLVNGAGGSGSGDAGGTGSGQQMSNGQRLYAKK